MTTHEQKLWYLLRDRRCRGEKFRRQLPIGPYIVDFCCVEKKLIVELDGGGHAGPEATAMDCLRDQFFQSNGFQVLRFWNNEVDNNLSGVYQRIVECLSPPLTRSEADHPLPQGERGIGVRR